MRDLILYVTLDDEDYLRLNQPKATWHLPNVNRLNEIAQQRDLRVEAIYMADLTEGRLRDPRLLALFGAGSFPEWYRQVENEYWRSQLERYADLLRTTSIPMFAVCGTHQFVTAAFQGWGAVGHIMPHDAEPVTIADELREGKGKIPVPRLGEVGIFAFRLPMGTARDPILEGLPACPRFVQYHRDTVLDDRHPGFCLLLEPDPETVPQFWLKDDVAHRNPTFPEDICRVQMLRLDSSKRLLYTTQFHPELPSGDPDVDANGARLLNNFFTLAERFPDTKL
jgi:GMP synthase-like glutamine amidotransferase